MRVEGVAPVPKNAPSAMPSGRRRMKSAGTHTTEAISLEVPPELAFYPLALVQREFGES
jgi:hypothetical protein